MNVCKSTDVDSATTHSSMRHFARFGTICAILKVKNTHGGVLLLAKLQAEACNFTKNNTPPWVFITFLNCIDDTKSRKAQHLYSNQISKHSIYLKNKDYAFPLNVAFLIRPDVLQDYVFPLNFIFLLDQTYCSTLMTKQYIRERKRLKNLFWRIKFKSTQNKM